ncbi:L,D-transpeptidase [Geomonas sp. Red32]|uniref:L,D-transpeptidase n=1 Tax=Geomonas sp. Red32 TaxID=2912856 RepID=UPI00202CE779|nr:L,D-transpeptidase [Geomonas sp. Red32]MCM0084164.1 L,D-transpeptidase [Geomonas sp. Red32]
MRTTVKLLTLLMLVLLPAPAAISKEKISSLCDLHYPSDARIEWRCVKLRWTDTAEKMFGAHWLDVLRFNRMDRRHFHGGISIKVPKHPQQLNSFTPLPAEYPQEAGEPKLIVVDQTEMFLGAYEYGKLVYSFPVALGIEGYRVPNGEYRVDAADRRHRSNLYTVEEIGRPYPMHFGLRFWVDKSKESWPSYWIHGRDLPGYPASHGCIGLYDEEMQREYYSAYDKKVNKQYYHPLTKPFLQDAKVLYTWAVDQATDPGKFHKIKNGPKVLIVGTPPAIQTASPSAPPPASDKAPAPASEKAPAAEKSPAKEKALTPPIFPSRSSTSHS